MADYFSCQNVTQDEVVCCVRKSKPKLFSGSDGIPSFMIKGCAEISVPVIPSIFNLSLQYTVYPSPSKIFVVIPVLKSGNPGDANNFRPLSVFVDFSTLLKWWFVNVNIPVKKKATTTTNMLYNTGFSKIKT